MSVYSECFAGVGVFMSEYLVFMSGSCGVMSEFSGLMSGFGSVMSEFRTVMSDLLVSIDKRPIVHAEHKKTSTQNFSGGEFLFHNTI